MKILVNSAILVLALATVLSYSGCGRITPPGPTIEELQLEKMNGIWGMTGTADVKLDGVSKKTDYTNFKLTLTGTAGAETFNYSTAGRPPLSPWPSSGKWIFGGSVESMVVRDPGTGDELAVAYAVTDDELQITFNFSKTGYSRTKKVTGEWVFTLKKE